MRNIFMLYMPPGNPEAMVHYEDIHLHRARLFHDKGELKNARVFIEQCNYWRRKEELEDAENAAATW